MPIKDVDENVAPVAARPEFFRLPKPGQADRYFGFSRSFFYELEKRRELKLVRICATGRTRGVTLVPYADVLKFCREAAQNETERKIT